MFDTIHFSLSQDDLSSRVDFLRELPGSLTDVAMTVRDGGLVTLRGSLGNLTIRATRHQMSVRDGSLGKWYLGDNFKVLGRADTAEAIECLSDTLHLPMARASITRIDVGCGLIMQYPTGVYFDHLGQMSHTARLQQPTGLYYSQSAKTLCFYDKVKEARKHHEPIPELFEGKNVLRYECRYTRRLPKSLNVPEVRGAMLSERGSYNSLLHRWRDNYRAIQKVNQFNLDFHMVNTKKDLYKWGLQAGIESIGGQAEMLRQIAEAQQRGDLTKKQAYDLRAAVVGAYKIDGVMTTASDAIQELDKRVAEAVKMYE